MEEIEQEIESTQSDASEGSSSEASESNSEQAEASAAAKQETTPFHEHPRFKELVEQKNSYAKELEAIRAQNKAFEQQLHSFKESQPKAPTETDQLLADLKKVDPRLANVIESQLKAAKTAEAVQQRLEQFERANQEQAHRQVLQTAVSKINSLHESNKVSDFGKQFIESKLDLAYRSGQLNASDIKAVEKAYNDTLKSIKDYEESIKRDTTKSYVQGKAKDSSVPASLPKGAQAKPAQGKVPSFKSKDELRQAVVKAYAKETSQAKEASNT